MKTEEINMKLTSQQALQLLENSKGLAQDDSWITHSKLVGEACARIAAALKLPDLDYAKTLGLVHDIGKRGGYHAGVIPHAIDGYQYLHELGYPDKYANICLTHSFFSNDIQCMIGGLPDPTDPNYRSLKKFIANHECSDYEKIASLCDLMCTTKFCTLEYRLIEIIMRRGAFENTRRSIISIYNLKTHIEEKLGFSVYKLFPEIKENL